MSEGHAGSEWSSAAETLLEKLFSLYKNSRRIDLNRASESYKELILSLSKIIGDAWIITQVYIDLRRRGRIVRLGPRRGSFLVKTSKKQTNYKYYILVLEERTPVPLRLITSFIEEAIKNKWEPMLAIVDRYGDVTYYTPLVFEPSKQREGGKVTSSEDTVGPAEGL